MNTDTLIAETVRMKSEDVRQEYLALRLEGCSRAEATRLSGPADPLASRNRQRGPLVNGQRPMVSDFRETENLKSSTADYRTDIERETEWESNEQTAATVNDILDRIPPVQADAVRTVYGLQTGTYMSHADAAAQSGVPQRTMKHRIRSAHKNMLKIVDSRAA